MITFLQRSKILSLAPISVITLQHSTVKIYITIQCIDIFVFPDKTFCAKNENGTQRKSVSTRRLNLFVRGGSNTREGICGRAKI